MVSQEISRRDFIKTALTLPFLLPAIPVAEAISKAKSEVPVGYVYKSLSEGMYEEHRFEYGKCRIIFGAVAHTQNTLTRYKDQLRTIISEADLVVLEGATPLFESNIYSKFEKNVQKLEGYRFYDGVTDIVHVHQKPIAIIDPSGDPSFLVTELASSYFMYKGLGIALNLLRKRGVQLSEMVGLVAAGIWETYIHYHTGILPKLVRLVTNGFETFLSEDENFGSDDQVIPSTVVFRDDRIAERLKQLCEEMEKRKPNPTITVIYGLNHYEPIRHQLENTPSSIETVKGPMESLLRLVESPIRTYIPLDDPTHQNWVQTY